MSADTQPAVPASPTNPADKPIKQLEKTANLPKKNEVGVVGIVLLTLYLILLGIVLFLATIALWPNITQTGVGGSASASVKLFFWHLNLSNEVRMLLIVAVVGALGSLIHDLRSLFWYVGNRSLKHSWVLMYFITPLVGSILALIFYLVLRGGLFSSQVTIQDTNPYGFAGIAGLIGMFSNQAALKLKEVAESLFSTKESTKGADHFPSEAAATPDESKTPPTGGGVNQPTGAG